MFILLLVKPKRHGITPEKSPAPPAAPIDDASIARPVNEEDPGAFILDALDSPEDGAPFTPHFPRLFHNV